METSHETLVGTMVLRDRVRSEIEFHAVDDHIVAKDVDGILGENLNFPTLMAAVCSVQNEITQAAMDAVVDPWDKHEIFESYKKDFFEIKLPNQI